MMDVITTGVLDGIFNDRDNANTRCPVLQCLQIKPLSAQVEGGAERYLVILSDVHHYVQCMLATQVNHVVNDHKLVKNCIVRVTQYQANLIKGKNILIILGLEVIKSHGTPDKLGEPQAFEAKPMGAENTLVGSQNCFGAKQEQTEQSTIYPIDALSPYAYNWTIKARVTHKSDIHTWHKPSGDGKAFSVSFIDESGQIKATGFNKLVDRYYELLQVGEVYYISNPCKIQLANKKYTNIPGDYELIFERDTVIKEAKDQTSVPQVSFDFWNIKELQKAEKNAIVDVVGVMKDVAKVSQITSKTTGKPYEKRELILVDNTNYSVRVTIWGKSAADFDAKPESVVAFKGTKVSDFGGRSLSLPSSGTMFIDPDIPDAYRLKGWYDSSGRNDIFSTHNNMASTSNAIGRKDQDKSIIQVKDENLGMEDQPDYFNLKATIVYIRQENFAYPACMNERCNKKVTEISNGTWRCEACDVSHPKPEYRYIMSINVCDYTSHLWLSCFDNAGQLIMGMTANQLMTLRADNETKLAPAFAKANFCKWNFHCRAKMDTVGESQRVTYQVMNISPIDFEAEGAKLANLIQQFSINS